MTRCKRLDAPARPALVRSAAARLRRGGFQVTVVPRLWGFADLLGLAADQHTALIVAVTGPCKDRGDVLPLILTSPSARAWLSVRGHYLEVWRCHPAVGGGIEVQRQPVRRESLGRPDQRPLPAGALSWQGG